MANNTHDIHSLFTPSYTPKEMLAQGIFGGCYFSTRPQDWFELPEDWRKAIPQPINYLAKDNFYLAAHNRFGVQCGTSLKDWQDAGMIRPQDPLGWFQWYCRYYQGRRTDDDSRQIKRWRNFVNRHMAQLIKQTDGKPGADMYKYPARRQSLLHWSWDSSVIPDWMNQTK
jgi:hypothetical protein